jgi:hypothetical protein
MILTEEIEVCIVPSNIKYYRGLGLDVKLMMRIVLPVYKLPNQSNLKVDVMCDRCGTKRYIKYQSYNFNIDRSLDKKTYMCDKCSHEKIKKTNLEKYGVEYFSQTQTFNEKVKQTSLEKYGKDHYSKTDEYLLQRTSTNLEKYGVENPFQLTEKIKLSMFLKYGVDHASQIYSNKETKEKKRRETKEKNGDWIKTEDLTDWTIYKNKVRSQTLKNKKELFEKWDGLDFYDGESIRENLGLHHHDPKYPTIDHKVSVYYGFTNGIETDYISDPSNLAITKRIINIKKGISNQN